MVFIYLINCCGNFSDRLLHMAIIDKVNIKTFSIENLLFVFMFFFMKNSKFEKNSKKKDLKMQKLRQTHRCLLNFCFVQWEKIKKKYEKFPKIKKKLFLFMNIQFLTGLKPH